MFDKKSYQKETEAQNFGVVKGSEGKIALKFWS
jgi:hypothetical protein